MAVEAVKIGYGDRIYIASVLGCRRDTVIRFMRKMATKTGLTTTDHVIKKMSQTQRKATDAFGEDLYLSLIQSCRDGQHGQRRGWHWRVEMK
jgi:hypothetical protein